MLPFFRRTLSQRFREQKASDGGRRWQNQESDKGRVGMPERANHKPLLTQTTEGNNAGKSSARLRMANGAGVSWSLPVMGTSHVSEPPATPSPSTSSGSKRTPKHSYPPKNTSSQLPKLRISFSNLPKSDTSEDPSSLLTSE